MEGKGRSAKERRSRDVQNVQINELKAIYETIEIDAILKAFVQNRVFEPRFSRLSCSSDSHGLNSPRQSPNQPDTSLCQAAVAAFHAEAAQGNTGHPTPVRPSSNTSPTSKPPPPPAPPPSSKAPPRSSSASKQTWCPSRSFCWGCETSDLISKNFSSLRETIQIERSRERLACL